MSLDFFDNGSVEIEKFISQGNIYGEDSLRAFFEKYEKQKAAERQSDEYSENTSEHHTQKALNQYQHGHVSLARAAEIAEVDQETFKRLLKDAGIERHIESAGNAFEREVEQLMRLRNSSAS